MIGSTITKFVKIITATMFITNKSAECVERDKLRVKTDSNRTDKFTYREVVWKEELECLTIVVPRVRLVCSR